MKITLVTGGTRSGKSVFAEKLLQSNNDVLYIATSIIFDKEMEQRVKKHKDRRNNLWDTYEGYKDLCNAIKGSSKSTIMLECIGTMITNIIFDKYSDVDNLSSSEVKVLEDFIVSEVENLISSVKENNKNIIIITNEVGLSLVSEYKLGRIFTDALGRVNQLIASYSDDVYFVVCGIPMKVK